MPRTMTAGAAEPMTHTAATVPPPTPPARSALALRRWFLIVSPLLAGLLAVLGSAMDPAAGISGPEMWRLYADNPDPLRWKSFGLHWSYTFWMLPALAVLLYVAWAGRVAREPGRCRRPGRDEHHAGVARGRLLRLRDRAGRGRGGQ